MYFTRKRNKKRRNKIILGAFAVLTLMFLIINSNEVFASKNVRTDYYIATINLNVRTGADTSYPVSFVLQVGDEVELISKRGSWYIDNINRMLGKDRIFQ